MALMNATLIYWPKFTFKQLRNHEYLAMRGIFLFDLEKLALVVSSQNNRDKKRYAKLGLFQAV